MCHMNSSRNTAHRSSCPGDVLGLGRGSVCAGPLSPSLSGSCSSPWCPWAALLCCHSHGHSWNSWNSWNRAWPGQQHTEQGGLLEEKSATGSGHLWIQSITLRMSSVVVRNPLCSSFVPAQQSPREVVVTKRPQEYHPKETGMKIELFLDFQQFLATC